MDLAKLVFDAIDVAVDNRINNEFVIEGSDKVIITKDVLYSDSDLKTCLLDYYYIPKKKGKYPVLFNIHGGGFVAGSKEYRRALCTWYAVDGFFVVNVNYGLIPNCSFPTPLEHLVEALNWVVKFAKILRLDLDCMIACGDSAGAYYASMLAIICKNEQLQKVFNVKPKAQFKATILNCGVYDVNQALSKRMMFGINKKIFTSYTGCKEGEFDNYKYKDYCSPLPFVAEYLPPTFVVYAKKDVLCEGQSELLIEQMDKGDVYYESYYSVSFKRNHCFPLDWKNKESKEVNALIKDFTFKVVNGSVPQKMSLAPTQIRGCEKRTK